MSDVDVGFCSKLHCIPYSYSVYDVGQWLQIWQSWGQDIPNADVIFGYLVGNSNFEYQYPKS